MTIGKMLLCSNELSFRLKHHEVGIEAFGNAALARLATGEPRRTFRHPSRDIRQSESAAAGLSPHHRQRQRKAEDPSPGPAKVPVAEPLHLRRTWRMIRRHQINDSFSKALPQFFAILPAADWRRALEKGLAVRDFVRREMQVMRTSFNAQWQPLRLRCADYVQRLIGRQVHNVQPKMIFAA